MDGILPVWKFLYNQLGVCVTVSTYFKSSHTPAWNDFTVRNSVFVETAICCAYSVSEYAKTGTAIFERGTKIKNDASAAIWAHELWYISKNCQMDEEKWFGDILLFSFDGRSFLRVWIGYCTVLWI